MKTQVIRRKLHATGILLVTQSTVGCGLHHELDEAADAGVTETRSDGSTDVNTSRPFPETFASSSAAAEPTSSVRTPSSSAESTFWSESTARDASDERSTLPPDERSTLPPDMTTAPENTSASETPATSEQPGGSSVVAPDTSAADVSTVPSGATTTDTWPSDSSDAEFENIDWLNPPEGLHPLGLSPDYAALDWVDVLWGSTLEVWSDSTTCSQVHDTGAGTFGFIECEAGPSAWSCRCYSDPQHSSAIELPTYLTQTAGDPKEACRLGAAVCLTDIPPSPAPVCGDNAWGGSSPHFCTLDQHCSFAYATSHGDVVKSRHMPVVTCGEYYRYPYEDSEFNCVQEGESDYFFVGKVASVPYRPVNQTCELGAHVYRNGVDVGSLGNAACDAAPAPSVEVVNGEERACTSSYRCSRPATALGEPIELVYDPRNVNCFRTSGGWQCGCDDSNEVSSWTEVDAATACANATAECIARIGE